MNENKKKMYDLSGPKTVEAMKKRHFDAYYCSTAAEAVEKALELIPKTDSVSWGGVMTVDELGLKQRLAQEGYTLIDRDTAKDPVEKQALMHQALSCGTFLMSSNAISKDGQLVNIDGMGNRVAAMCYGPRQGGVIAGMNKVLGTLDDAIARARNIAAPANAQRFGIKTPCGLTGQCGDNGVALDAGFTTPDPEEAAVKAAAVHRARETWFLVDDAKFSRIYPAVIADLQGGAILTNRCPNPKYKQFTLVKETEV
mgnify:CR=1 FL=1